jgi:SHS2 domain-containing protein
MKSMGPRHSFGQHVGEVSVCVEAPSLRELFEESGRALAELSAEVEPDAVANAEEQVELDARDREALLVAWLNELVFRSETRKLVYDDLTVNLIDDAKLSAVIRGRLPRTVRTAVKAATMHDLHIVAFADGLRVTIVLDV